MHSEKPEVQHPSSSAYGVKVELSQAKNSARNTFPGTFEKNIIYEHMNDFQAILNTFTMYVCALKI